MKDIWEEALKEMAGAGMTEEEFINNFRKAKKEADNEYEHQLWLEDLKGAREDFVEAFCAYIETLFGEKEEFDMPDEDVEYLYNKLTELEKDMLEQQDKLDKASKNLEKICKSMEKNNKRENEGGKRDSDLKVIQDWLGMCGLV